MCRDLGSVPYRKKPQGTADKNFGKPYENVLF